MKVRIFAGVAAMALTLGVAAAMAQPPQGSGVFNTPSTGTAQSNPAGSYEHGWVTVANGPQVGDGSSPNYLNDQQQILKEPGYNTGTAAASIEDGSDPTYLKDRQDLLKEFGPGYEGGTGNVRKGPGSPYGQGNAQSLVPSSGQYDLGSGPAQKSDGK